MSYPDAKSTIYTVCANCTPAGSINLISRHYTFLDWQEMLTNVPGKKRMTALYECPVCQTSKLDPGQSELIDD